MSSYQNKYYQKNKEKFKKYRQKYRKRYNKLLLEYREKNKDIMNQVRQIGCYFCNELDTDILEFAHVGLKQHRIGYGYSLKKLIKEIEKCEIMCANCHIKFDLKKLQLEAL